MLLCIREQELERKKNDLCCNRGRKLAFFFFRMIFRRDCIENLKKNLRKNSRCNSTPDWIYSFDNAITIEFDSRCFYRLSCSTNVHSSKGHSSVSFVLTVHLSSMFGGQYPELTESFPFFLELVFL